jgi:LAS superfamily LD-carboxypeptidase LdcB
MAKKRKIRTSVKIIFLVLVVAIAVLAGVLIVKNNSSNNQTAAAKIVSSSSPTAAPSASATPTATPAETASAEPTAEATAAAVEETAASAEVSGCESEVIDAAYTNTDSLLLLANKKHKLPEGYAPADLVSVQIPCYNGSASMRSEAAEALLKMYNAALNDGVSLAVSSCFRDENYQSALYYKYVNMYGAATADTISSRPGYSDHQTGLAGDFVEGSAADFNEEFEDTASGKWLAANAHLYGFIMRYPKGKASITGYEYEPWHFRYIGVANATSLYSAGPTESFEEYYNVSGGDYCAQ